MSRVRNIIDVLIPPFFGALTGINGFIGSEKLLEFENTKIFIIQNNLSNEITNQTYQAAKESAENLLAGDYISGMISLGLAGMCAGTAIYFACRKKNNFS